MKNVRSEVYTAAQLVRDKCCAGISGYTNTTMVHVVIRQGVSLPDTFYEIHIARLREAR